MSTAPPRIDRKAFRSALLQWYHANGRSLPWRETKDPYRIWVSEIMLQQTRVAAVVEYYRRFLAAFPTLSALSRANEQAVLAQWSGLGYYRRARMLHAAARKLTSEHRRIPHTSEQLRELPGIGRYTAAAIASIAFGEPSAVVDGNVERVLQRLTGKTPENAWGLAQGLLDKENPGDFNQAMMELGATLCLPKDPECLACPVRRWCALRGEHATAKPRSRKKAKARYVICVNRGRIALAQRPAGSRLMPEMWELPEASSSLFRTKPLLTVKHSITTTDYAVSVWKTKAGLPPGSVQLRFAQAAKLPLTGLTRKILRRLALLENL